MGLAWDGRVLCLHFGAQRVNDFRGATLEVLCCVPHVQELVSGPPACGEGWELGRVRGTCGKNGVLALATG